MKALIIVLSIYAFYAVLYAVFYAICRMKENTEHSRSLKEYFARYNEKHDSFEFVHPMIRERKQINGIAPEHLQIERKANIRERLKAKRLSGGGGVRCAYLLNNVCVKCGSKVLAVYETSEYYDGINIICLGCDKVLHSDCAAYKDKDGEPTPVLFKFLLLIFIPIWAPIALMIYLIYLICKWIKNVCKKDLDCNNHLVVK